LDFHEAEGAEAFRIMSTQEFLSFHFHGDNGRTERSFVTMNPLGEFFRAAIESLGKHPAWRRESFVEALATIQSRFPTPRDLWNQTGRDG
jgi:hypothetical protein